MTAEITVAGAHRFRRVHRRAMLSCSGALGVLSLALGAAPSGAAGAHSVMLVSTQVVPVARLQMSVGDEMLDLMKHCLTPAGINPKRRTAELTVAILQLVASGRGIAALPSWTVGNYIERGYVVSRPIGPAGLRCELYAATSRSTADAAYIREFVALTRTLSLAQLAGVSAL